MTTQPRFFLFMLLMALLTACSKEEFAGSPTSTTTTADQVTTDQKVACSEHTLVKPPVDVLYLVDNSPSASFLTSTIKTQLRQTITSISSEFDYHILVAPLISGTSLYTETNLPVLTNNAENIAASGTYVPTVVSFESLNVESFFSGTSGSANETGLNRVQEVINNYRSGTKPVFRQKAHTIVIMLSNGEDSTVYDNSGNGFKLFSATKYGTQLSNLRTLGYSTLQAQQFRFFSVVAHSVCQSGYKDAIAYRKMSQDLYTEALNRGNPSDQSGRSTPDSYNLCTSDFANMYSGVNNSIRQEVINHKYNFWPISNSMDVGSINTNNIEVYKVKEDGSYAQLNPSTTNGFQFAGARTGQNTRYEPTPGEPASGLFVQLYGDARVTYPDCVAVKTSTNIETYQYVVLPTAPTESTIIIRIRGTEISKGAANGWTYEGFRTNQNVKDPSSSYTPLNKTGYFVKLNGSSKYVSGDTVESYYVPAPIN